MKIFFQLNNSVLLHKKLSQVVIDEMMNLLIDKT